MTKKRFALIILVWMLGVAIIFGAPAQSKEIGLIQSQGVNCEDSIKDLAATTLRLDQLKLMINGTNNPHALLVLRTEAGAVAKLHKMILMWRVENCRDI